MVMSAKQESNKGLDGVPGLSLTEDDAFFLIKLLKHLETEAERLRLVDIAEQIAKFSSK